MASLWIHKLTLLFLLISSFSVAQVPVSPTQRPISGGGSASVGVAPKPPEKPVIKTITYITLSEARQWTSNDGKPLLAKLIAFEDVVTGSTGNSDATQTPVIPVTGPTLIKDGKVRLLVNRKPFELALDRLSPSDRDFIESTRVAIQKKAAPAK
ncbi:MAG: hypothetical protein RL693_2478 [Verrucomicrobiota bacterium]|jgi:hypothetical protein